LIVGFTVIAMAAALVLANVMTIWNLLLNLAYVMGPLALAIALGRGGSTKGARVLTFAIGLIGGLSVFAYIASTTNDFFSWWTLALVAFTCIPLIVPGPREQSNG